MRIILLITALLIISSCASNNGLQQQAINMEVQEQMEIRSIAFDDKGALPSKYTCDGANVNPPLAVKNIPSQAKSLALIVDDPDAPRGNWVHWVVWNIPVTGTIKEDSVPGAQGVNDFGKNSYGGPCPPSGTHRYFFRVYALNIELNLQESASKKNLEDAMRNHIVAKAEIVGTYKRKS